MRQLILIGALLAAFASAPAEARTRKPPGLYSPTVHAPREPRPPKAPGAGYRARGSVRTQVGDTSYGRSGSVSQKVGNTTYRRDGSGRRQTCQRIGGERYCY